MNKSQATITFAQSSPQNYMALSQQSLKNLDKAGINGIRIYSSGKKKGEDPLGVGI